MLKAIIFDMDGTLGDTLPLCIAAYQRTAKELLGEEPRPEDVTKWFGYSDRGVLAGLFGMAPEDPNLPLAHFVAVYEEMHDALAPAPFKGAAELLRRLRDELGLRLAIISGKEIHTAAPTLEKYGIRQYFEWLGLGKPTHNAKSERLAEYLEYSGLSAQEVIYVGDAPSDIEHCHRVGVPIISAGWAPAAAAEREACLALKPEYRVERFQELFELITDILK